MATKAAELKDGVEKYMSRVLWGSLTHKAPGNPQRTECRKGHLKTLSLLKEPLQTLWESETVERMQARLEVWCQIADPSSLLSLKKFVQSLRRHCVGLGNDAKHRLTSARIEAGNIRIDLIRKRARGIRDTEDFKLKIRQSFATG